MEVLPRTCIVGNQVSHRPDRRDCRTEESRCMEGTQRPVLIEDNGAKLRAADGLSFGCFDPQSGDSADG